jgi:hypothetical protein
MSKHKDPKTFMRYDHGRKNLDQNAVNFLVYDEEGGPRRRESSNVGNVGQTRA